LALHADDVQVSHDSTHWSLARAAGGAAAVSYEIADSKSGEIVLRDQVQLGCGSDHAAAVLGPGGGVTAVTLHAVAKPGWSGQVLAINFLPGIALLRTGNLSLQNQTGTVAAADLGVDDRPGTSIGLSISYLRPWFFASIGFNTAFATAAGRTIFELGGWSTVGTSLSLGPVSWYVGPSVSLSSYHVTGLNSQRIEWGTAPEVGLGAATGLRIHLHGAGPSAAVLGIDLMAPIVGHQPWLVVASLGWGFGH
jgi:hypothetical protein